MKIFLTKRNWNPEYFPTLDTIIMRNNEALFFIHEDKLIPTLILLLKDIFIPKVTVDMGAVRFVINGADVMRPGITEVENFTKDAISGQNGERWRHPYCPFEVRGIAAQNRWREHYPQPKGQKSILGLSYPDQSEGAPRKKAD